MVMNPHFFIFLPVLLIYFVEVKFELQHLSGDSNLGLFTSIPKITSHKQFLKEIY